VNSYPYPYIRLKVNFTHRNKSTKDKNDLIFHCFAVVRIIHVPWVSEHRRPMLILTHRVRTI